MREWINLLENMTRQEALDFYKNQGFFDLSPNGLKAARNSLIRKYHPDVNPNGDLDYVKKINAAYDVLTKIKNIQEPVSPRPQKKETEIPPWAWAGYSGGVPPHTNIYREDFTDLNFFKKRMWELSGKSTKEWTIMNFDGRYFRGTVTVFGNPSIFRFMAKAMRDWDSFYKSRAIFVQSKEANPIYLIWSDGIYHNPPIPFEHNSFNKNPGNDQSFVRELPDLLDNIQREKADIWRADADARERR